MAVVSWIVGLALAGLAGRLILWTTLRGAGPCASTLEAIRDALGAVEYQVAPLDLACRGRVVVRHGDSGAPGGALLRRLRGLEPQEVVALLKAEGVRAALVPAGGPRGGITSLRRLLPRFARSSGAGALRDRARPTHSPLARELPRS